MPAGICSNLIGGQRAEYVTEKMGYLSGIVKIQAAQLSQLLHLARADQGEMGFLRCL